jgi:hypothetical protein
VNRAANTMPLAFAAPIRGLPTCFFILYVYTYLASILVSVYSNGKRIKRYGKQPSI